VASSLVAASLFAGLEARKVRLELRFCGGLGSGHCAKTLKCSLRISHFFEGVREKFRETLVFGRCNFRAVVNAGESKRLH
jgi:hypothetical protein